MGTEGSLPQKKISVPANNPFGIVSWDAYVVRCDRWLRVYAGLLGRARVTMLLIP